MPTILLSTFDTKSEATMQTPANISANAPNIANCRQIRILPLIDIFKSSAVRKNDPPAKPGACMCVQSHRMPAAPSQAYGRSGLCAGLLLAARERRAFLFLAALERDIVLPKHRHLISQLPFVQLVSDVLCNLLFVLPYNYKGWGSGVGRYSVVCFS